MKELVLDAVNSLSILTPIYIEQQQFLEIIRVPEKVEEESNEVNVTERPDKNKKLLNFLITSKYRTLLSALIDEGDTDIINELLARPICKQISNRLNAFFLTKSANTRR